MTALNASAHRLLAQQHGIIGTDQLIGAGHSTAEIRWMQHRGSLIRVLRGAYRTPSAPFTEASRCAAVCIARQNVTIAGPTAGRLWGFRLMPADLRVHVIGPPASNPAIAQWVHVYRTAAIHSEDVAMRPDGIRLTSRARTTYDLARWLAPSTLLSVIEQAAHDGRLDDHDFSAVATDWLSPRRPWAATFLGSVSRRMDGGAAESHPEVRVANALRQRGVGGLVRQHAVRFASGRRARFDLASPSFHIAIEVDVHPRHDETAGRQSDGERDAEAAASGWTTIRISRDDYFHRFDDRLDRVAERFRQLTAMSHHAP